MHQQFHEILKKNLLKTKIGLKPSEIILPKCEYLASNCQPGLEGYLVKSRTFKDMDGTLKFPITR